MDANLSQRLKKVAAQPAAEQEPKRRLTLMLKQWNSPAPDREEEQAGRSEERSAERADVASEATLGESEEEYYSPEVVMAAGILMGMRYRDWKGKGRAE
jgi:hypothetical protein